MQVTRLLQRMHGGDREAVDVTVALVYAELKKLARSRLRRELKATPLDTTSLVHEAYLRMAGSRHPSYENRAHFFGIVSRLMRQVLVDNARAQATEKRGAAVEVSVAVLPETRVAASQAVLSLNDALQALEKLDERKSRLVEMHYFGGMTAEESALALSIPVHQVRRELREAESFLRRELS